MGGTVPGGVGPKFAEGAKGQSFAKAFAKIMERKVKAKEGAAAAAAVAAGTGEAAIAVAGNGLADLILAVGERYMHMGV